MYIVKKADRLTYEKVRERTSRTFLIVETRKNPNFNHYFFFFKILSLILVFGIYFFVVLKNTYIFAVSLKEKLSV